MNNKVSQMRKEIRGWFAGQQLAFEDKMRRGSGLLQRVAIRKEDGIDGILVTVGLCIIALLLCVLMKDSLTTFIETIVQSMTEKADLILTGTTT